MAVRRGPWNIVASDNVADTINTLRAIADELEADPKTLGAVVVVVREGRSGSSYTVSAMGKLRRAKEIAFFVLHRAASGLIYNK